MDKISTLTIVVFTVVMIVTSFASVIRSAESLKETHNEEQSQLVSFIIVIFSTLMGLTFKVMPPIVYAIILVIIAGLHLLNQEGSMRRQSWNLLATGYVFILILSVIFHRKDNVFQPLTLLWIIPVVLPFIAGAVQAVRLNNTSKTNKTGVQLSERIVPWAITAILTLAVIVLFVLVLTRR